MNVQILPLTQSWTSGSELWVTAPPSKSHCSRKLDWYLNFRITKGLRSEIPNRSENLESLLKTLRWDLPAQKDWNTQPLLVAAQNWLPCKWVLVLHELNREQLSHGLASLTKIWKEFNQPKMRLFLPSHLNQEALRKAWESSSLPQEFEMVLE